MARVPQIGLDFVRPSGGVARIAAVLLVAGVLSALAVLEEQRGASREARDREARLEEMRNMSRRTMPAIEAEEADTPEVRDQVKKANAVLAQMNVPWGELFAAVEMAQDDNVGLLAVQPDARARSVTIGGEARTLQALFAYMTRLERNERLRDVVLTSHEVKIKDPGQPVDFVLTARWVEAP